MCLGACERFFFLWLSTGHGTAGLTFHGRLRWHSGVISLGFERRAQALVLPFEEAQEAHCHQLAVAIGLWWLRDFGLPSRPSSLLVTLGNLPFPSFLLFARCYPSPGESPSRLE